MSQPHSTCDCKSQCCIFAPTINTTVHIPGTVITHSDKSTGKLITLFYVVVTVGKIVLALFTINPLAQVTVQPHTACSILISSYLVFSLHISLSPTVCLQIFDLKVQ